MRQSYRPDFFLKKIRWICGLSFNSGQKNSALPLTILYKEQVSIKNNTRNHPASSISPLIRTKKLFSTCTFQLDE